MTTYEWVTILAVIAGPILAVQAQKFIEAARETRDRRLRVFETLMATRAARLSYPHVEALNRIDLGFRGKHSLLFWRREKPDKPILDAWKLYLDHLSTPGQDRTWVEKAGSLFIDLLFELSKALGYEFDKVHLKRMVYSPQAHGTNELVSIETRDRLLKVLTGEQPVAVVAYAAPEILELQRKAYETMIAFYERQGPNGDEKKPGSDVQMTGKPD